MAHADSEPAEVTLPLQGVWIMDPESGGQESARQYLYGANQRDESLEVQGEANHFAGRASPVIDFGEHETRTVLMVVDVPHGPAWRGSLDDLRGWATARKTLHIRDNRGRALYGALANLRLRDTAWGTQASFAVTRVDWVQEVLTA